MSKSVKHSPCTTVATHKSNKADKIEANRKLRRKSKQALAQDKEPIYRTREISDVWDFSSDGLAYWVHPEKWGMRYARFQGCDMAEGLKRAKDELRKLLRK